MPDPLKTLLQRSRRDVSFFPRFGAYLVDTFLLNLVVLYPLEKFLSSYADFSLSVIDMRLLLVLLFVVVLSWCYWTVMDFYFSRTLGKMFFGLRVVTKSGKLSFSQAFLRNVTKPFSVLLLFDSWKLFVRSQKMRYTEEVTSTWVEYT